MSADCCKGCDDPHRGNENYRRMLWVVLAINALMFAVEVVAGLAAGSASLQADALDFLGDAETTPSAFLWWAWRFVIALSRPF
jgi:Co/Zn/Cd efflux system component